MDLRAATVLLLISTGCDLPNPHQNRTLGNIATVASVLDDYARDQGHYPIVRDPRELTAQLIPKYLPQPGGYVGENGTFVDDWGGTLRYECWGEPPAGAPCTHYALASAGSDGKFTIASLRDAPPIRFDGADGDIVYRDRQFVRYPARMETNR